MILRVYTLYNNDDVIVIAQLCSQGVDENRTRKNVSKKGQRSSNKFKPKQCASQSNTVVMAER